MILSILLFESFGVVCEGLVFDLKVGRYILCDRILRTQPTTLSLPERAEFTTQQMLSNKSKWRKESTSKSDHTGSPSFIIA